MGKSAEIEKVGGGWAHIYTHIFCLTVYFPVSPLLYMIVVCFQLWFLHKETLKNSILWWYFCPVSEDFSLLSGLAFHQPSRCYIGKKMVHSSLLLRCGISYANSIAFFFRLHLDILCVCNDYVFFHIDQDTILEGNKIYLMTKPILSRLWGCYSN